ncbi:hypothetical protein BDW72DRAFT_38887 [Aspergillus terricola var. indicus]
MEPPPRRTASQRGSSPRPSFQAPTKASIARSYPELLERPLSRSPTRTSTRSSQDDKQKEAETRAFGLRDRKALRPSIALTTSPSNTLNRGRQSQSPFTLASQRSSGLGAFAAPPRRVSKRISASDFLFQSPSTSRETRVEESLVNTPEDQLAVELGSATGMDLNEDTVLHNGFDEPDLPPTPTQLGLEPPPGRPRGLMSDTPSMQHVKWGKRRASEDLESSPSKLTTLNYSIEPEDLTITTNDAPFPESIVKKRKLKRELLAQLESLKQDLAKLEGLCDKFDKEEGGIEPYLNDLCPLLISTDPSHANSTNSRINDNTISSLISTLLPFSTKRPQKPRQVSPELNHFSLGQSAQADSYLTALAPLKISATLNAITKSKLGMFVERHQITLSAPRPFPLSVYKIDVYYETNPETQSVVSLAASVDGTTLKYLQQWVNERLQDPLRRLDVSGLCWGINRYWEALVSRAQIWAQFWDQYPALIPGRNRPPSIKVNSDLDIRRILPHLQRTSILFKSKQKTLEALLSCELTVDNWTGEPELRPTICVSISGYDSSSDKKVEQEAKKLFEAVMNENKKQQLGTAGGSEVEAVVKATNCVLDALFGQNGDHQL